MNDVAIKVSQLTKVYKLYEKPIDRLKESLNPFKKKYHKDFYALNEVDFNIIKGETVGIIGKNGAGKSTLLKIITGVLSPSSGHVKTNGRISSLLELGAGFNPEYTGIENIYLQGTLLGLGKKEMEGKVDEICSFADIGDFIYQPVKSYSSGMYARLAFAVAINVEPDILIVDEALSVGDMRFQQKCYRKFREFQEAKKTILFVTHDIGTIINYCSHVIWINDGKVVDEGDPDQVCKKYMSVLNYDLESDNGNSCQENNGGGNNVHDELQWACTSALDSFGEKEVQITHTMLVDEYNIPKSMFIGGERVILKMKLHSFTDVYNFIIGFVVNDNIGNDIFGSNTEICNSVTRDMKKNKEYVIEFYFTMPLISTGKYLVSTAIAEGTQYEHTQHHWIHDAIAFEIQSASKFANIGGILNIEVDKLKLEEINNA